MIINVFIERASVIDKNLYCNALFKHSSRCRKLRMPYGLFLMARSIILGVRLREERWLKVICPVANTENRVGAGEGRTGGRDACLAPCRGTIVGENANLD